MWHLNRESIETAVCQIDRFGLVKFFVLIVLHNSWIYLQVAVPAVERDHFLHGLEHGRHRRDVLIGSGLIDVDAVRFGRFMETDGQIVVGTHELQMIPSLLFFLVSEVAIEIDVVGVMTSVVFPSPRIEQRKYRRIDAVEHTRIARRKIH